MGVTGLWRLIDPSGKAVPLETLEGKVLAIDISIWIYQVLQGYQDKRGHSIPNAHLLGLYHRICKLLYFKIKPVFVFDGGVPLLKRNTIAQRKKQKALIASRAEKIKSDLLHNLVKRNLVKGTDAVLAAPSTSKGTKTVSDMFKLPEMNSSVESGSGSESDDPSPRKNTKWKGNIHSVDINSDEFKALPPDVRYDILTDLKETRKQNSWGRLHEMPEESNQFSNYQMRRLLKRRIAQESLELAEREMGGKTLTLEELEKLMAEQGVDTKGRNDKVFRIASDDRTRMIYINDPKNMPAKRDDVETVQQKPGCSKDSEDLGLTVIPEEQSLDTAVDNLEDYDLEEEWDEDIEMIQEITAVPKRFFGKVKINPAMSYMMENTELSQEQILALIHQSKETIRRSKAEERTKRRNSGKVKSAKKSKFEMDFDIWKYVDVKKEVESPEGSDCEIVGSEEVAESSEDVKTNVGALEAPKSVEEVEEMSDSESDDFVEVSESSVKIPEKKKMEIVIKETDKIDDDLFADVFEVKAEDVSLNSSGGSGIEEKMVEARREMAEKEGEVTKVKRKLELSERSGGLSESDEEDVKLSVKNVELEAAQPSKSELESKDDVQIIESSELKVDHPSDTKKDPEESIENLESAPVDDLAEVSEPIRPQETPEEPSVPSAWSLPKPPTLPLPPPTKQPTSSDLASILSQIQSEKEELLSKISNLEDLENVTAPPEEVEAPLEAAPQNPTGEPLEVSENLISSSSQSKTSEEPTLPESTKVPQPSISKQPKPSIVTSVLNQLESEKADLITKMTNQEELDTLRSQLEHEAEELKDTIGKLEHKSIEITEQMRTDAQELLRLFGIPYVVAPQEAEAQCAYLELINLTDGTVTDDSDIWLFGGRCVYKNFFNNEKRVMQYLSKDIEHHFKLTRSQMIQLALLVGSDYTVGIPGIGPVTALEVLASFPGEGDDLLRGLSNFASWLRGGRVVGPGKAALRNKLKNVSVDRGFPSQAVVQAYLSPTVDESKETFTWGKPNLVLLADYTRQKFGWTRARFDEVMEPVMKRLQGKSQKDILSYFKVSAVPKSIEGNISKRVQKAVEKLGRGGDGEDEDDAETPDGGESTAQNGGPKKRRRAPKKKTVETKEGEIAVLDADSDEIPVKKPAKPKKEVIPQREKDKAEALKKKLQAIEVFRKSHKGPGKARGKPVRPTRNVIKKQAQLSESSGDDD